MELVSYAIDFVSFLAQNFKEIGRIKSIILFGSVARGEAEKNSDIDIFIDVEGDEKKIEKEIKKIKNDFFSSIKFRKYWKLFGIENEINPIVGKIDKWRLKDSMLGNAIILYENYKPKLKNGRNIAVLTWGNIKPDSRRVMLNKKLFGYTYYGKRYKGLLDAREVKIGTNVIFIDIERLNSCLLLFHKFKVPVKIIRVFEYL